MSGQTNAISGAALIAAALVFSAGSASAIIDGHASGLHAHMVRVNSGGYCSGVAIGRQAVVTAGHCARGASINADGQRIAVSKVTRSAVIDGRRVSVAGDAAILMLRAPLPGSISPLPVGSPGDGAFTIAGFGTASEAQRMAVGTLREARLVQASHHRWMLVDPNRSGKLSASACFGDSGGAVMQNGVLVGVITRANYPRAPIACGWYTQYAPVTASGPAAVAQFPAASPSYAALAEEQPRTRRGRRTRERVVASIAAYPPSEYAAPFTVAAAEKTTVRKAKKGKKKKFKKRRKPKRYLL